MQKKLPWEHVSLGPLEYKEIEKLVSWQNDSKIRDQTMGFRFPVSLESAAEWMNGKRMANGTTGTIFSINLDDNFVGIAALNDLNWINRNAQFGIYLGEKSASRKGVGFCASSLLLDFAFSGIGLEKVHLQVIEGNHSAANLYKELGFQLEGNLRSHYFLDGRFLDINLMGILKDEWQIRLPKTARRWSSAMIQASKELPTR